MRWTPRLRSVLFAVNLAILLVPLGGVVLLRLYESVLIRRTEAELVAQAAHVAGAFLVEVNRELAAAPDAAGYGRPTGPPRATRWSRAAEPTDAGGPFQPHEARLDLAVDPVLPPPPEARPPEVPPDPVALAAGARITEGMRAAQKVTLAGIRVVDFRGTVVATTRSEHGLSLAGREEVDAALRGTPAVVMRQRFSDEPPPAIDSLSRSTKLRVFVAMPVVDRGRVLGAVVLSRTPMNVGKSLYYIRWHLLAGALALVFLVGLVSFMTSWTIGAPMKDLIDQTVRVARGERGAARPLARPGTHEVRQVSEAIARMAQAIEERSEYIRTFAASVSHEFKTPLAGMRGAVELLRDHLDTMTAEERDRFLQNLEKDAERLSRLVGRLADLARADVVKPSTESTELGPVVEEIAARYEADGLRITLDAAPEPVRVLMAREPLESLLTNLVDNARQHGGEDVSIVIATDLEEREGVRTVSIVVADDGPGISESNQQRVFDRFFTTARERGGSGLGLSIVKTLVDAHGGAVALASRPGRTCFTVRLPGPS